jgi:hypothetical protein
MKTEDFTDPASLTQFNSAIANLSRIIVKVIDYFVFREQENEMTDKIDEKAYNYPSFFLSIKQRTLMYLRDEHA